MAHRASIDLGTVVWPYRPSAVRPAGLPVRPAIVAVLRFALPRGVSASVLVHDSQGKVIRTLLAGELSAGEHACGWDGCDEHRVPTPAGNYTVRLEIADRLVTARRVSIA